MKIDGKWLGDIFFQDYFSGDGATVTFNLTHTPHSNEAIEVYVNGVKLDQAPFYTVNLGTPSITFLSPPANGQGIEVSYVRK